MISPAPSPTTNSYRVEVSGWDENKAFFVENSHLEWSEESGKRVTLTRSLHNGALVFVRLLQQITADRGHPVAYEAEFAAAMPGGSKRFHLRPLRSRRDCK